MSIFKSSKKSPLEISKNLKESIFSIENSDFKKNNTLVKAQEEVSKQIANMKAILFSQSENETPNDIVITLCKEIMDQNLLNMLINYMPKLDFEAKKDFVLIFGNLLRKTLPTLTFVDLLLQQKNLLTNLIDSYPNQDVTLNIGMMIRESLKYPRICEYLLNSPEFKKFFNFLNDNTFHVGSDAYLTFKEILTRHKELVASYLMKNYEYFFELYGDLLNSANYVTKRQSIKLLGELLVDRNNSGVLLKFVSSIENLKLIMTLMRDPSSSVQHEAFHIFKIFVVHPDKTSNIVGILIKNRDKLIEHLQLWQNNRKGDEQFMDESQYVIKQIKDLKEQPL